MLVGSNFNLSLKPALATQSHIQPNIADVRPALRLSMPFRTWCRRTQAFLRYLLEDLKMSPSSYGHVGLRMSGREKTTRPPLLADVRDCPATLHAEMTECVEAENRLFGAFWLLGDG